MKVKIVAEVIADVECESLEELKTRFIDIYLHGPNPDGWEDKIDLGGNLVSVEEFPDYERITQNVCPLLVGK